MFRGLRLGRRLVSCLLGGPVENPVWRKSKAKDGLRPACQTHVRWCDPNFLYAALSNYSVCGFLQGKPHEVRQRHQASQEIRGNMGHPYSAVQEWIVVSWTSIEEPLG
jgi:hypothetical protein